MAMKKEEKIMKTEKTKKCKTNNPCGDTCGSMVYILGFVGALIYYISTATGFWIGVLGVLKSIVWPVFVVYGLLRFLGL